MKNNYLMNLKFFIPFLTLFLFISCKQDFQLTKIEGKRLDINDSLATNQEIDNFIKPFRDNVNKNLDGVLSYAVDTYSKSDGELNTAIGNLMADAVMEQSNPVFKSRTNNEIDVVLLNHGGIRSILSQGNVTSRTAYQIMPFENSVVVVDLKGTYILELVDYLRRSKRAHPISGMQLTLDQNDAVSEVTINGETIDPDRVYHVATNDYLYSGGSGMTFFQKKDSVHVLNYKIRNVLIDYFKAKDTLNPIIDNRFIRN